MIPILLALLTFKPLPHEPQREPILVGQTVSISSGNWVDGEHFVYRGIGRVIEVQDSTVLVECWRDGLWICIPSEVRRIVP